MDQCILVLRWVCVEAILFKKRGRFDINIREFLFSEHILCKESITVMKNFDTFIHFEVS